MTGPPIDPLADYDPHWRTKQSADPLAGYHPGWREAAKEPDVQDSGYLDRLSTHVLNAAQGLPGVGAVEAGAGVIGSQVGRLFGGKGMSYPESYATLKEMTGRVGDKTSRGERALGAIATAPFLPANPALAGGLYGALGEVADANPDRGAASRGGGALVAGALGAATGGVLGRWTTAARAVGATNAATNVIDREATRGANAAPRYATAEAEGVANGTRTAQVASETSQPDNAAIIARLRETREFRNLADDDPKMLDALYKVHSDEAGRLGRAADAPTPTRPNIGRFAERDVRQAQAGLLNAMDRPMPSYRGAVEGFAKESNGIDAVEYGSDLAKMVGGHGITSGKNLTRNTPQQFSEWVKTASPEEIAAVKEGILGSQRATGGKAVPGMMLRPKSFIPFTAPKASADALGDLLRRADPREGSALQAGVIGLTAAARHR